MGCTAAAAPAPPVAQFAEGRVPRPADRVVYMCGGFDLFNAGHVAALQVMLRRWGPLRCACCTALSLLLFARWRRQAARECGDFLLVGVHDDATINEIRGHGLPGAPPRCCSSSLLPPLAPGSEQG